MGNVLKKILIVDDEVSIRTMLFELLSGKDNEVITGGTMKEALEACSRNKFDLVITDLRLSGRNSSEGFDIISHVKSKDPDTNIMLITGYGNDTILKEAINRGASCYFEKPFDMLELAGKVRSFGIPLPHLYGNSFRDQV